MALHPSADLPTKGLHDGAEIHGRPVAAVLAIEVVLPLPPFLIKDLVDNPLTLLHLLCHAAFDEGLRCGLGLNDMANYRPISNLSLLTN